jgi:hypothetical protein
VLHARKASLMALDSPATDAADATRIMEEGATNHARAERRHSVAREAQTSRLGQRLAERAEARAEASKRRQELHRRRAALLQEQRALETEARALPPPPAAFAKTELQAQTEDLLRRVRASKDGQLPQRDLEALLTAVQTAMAQGEKVPKDIEARVP